MSTIGWIIVPNQELKNLQSTHHESPMRHRRDEAIMSRDKDIQRVKALPPFGGSCEIFWYEEGGGDVYRIWDMFFLFSIPQYGGEGRFEGAFGLDEVEKLVDLAHTWT